MRLTARDNLSRTGLFIKNNKKPRKHCVCEVFFLPEKRAENCSKTESSPHYRCQVALHQQRYFFFFLQKGLPEGEAPLQAVLIIIYL